MAEDALGVDIDAPRPDVDADVDWPSDLEVTYQNLKQVKPERVVNLSNLGDLAFVGAEERLADIVKILEDLRLEEWRLIRSDLGAQIVANATHILNTLQQMAELRSSQPDAQAQRNNIEAQFQSYYQFFVDQVRPICITARVLHLLRTRKDLLGGDLTSERVEELQAAFSQLSEHATEFQQLAPLVATQRELLGREGVAKLSADFDERSATHADAFKNWAIALFASVVAGGGAAVLFVLATRPDSDATAAEITTHVLLDVLVVGLVVFLVRFVAMQARGHRHMQFVTRNKANALSTFNKIVQGQDDPAVRADVASALAMAVFKSDDGVFADASSDTVTIIERLGSAAAARIPTSS